MHVYKTREEFKQTL